MIVNTIDHQAIHPRETIGALLTVNGVADVLAVSRGTIYNLVKTGDLVAVRVGERLRFRPEALEAYLARHSRPEAA